jgi:hypothetical protein
LFSDLDTFRYQTQVLQRLPNIFLASAKHQKFVSVMARSFSSANSTVIAEEKGNAGVITLNRPKALHSINLEMVT